ncbi:MAG: hypothetical protein RLY31_1275 [Bacteroidota bacterium]|jgi:MoxR-like ATPase
MTNEPSPPTEDGFQAEDRPPRLDTTPVQQAAEAVRQTVASVLIGQDTLVDLLLTALLCNGHVLVEGVPGIAKTLTAKLLAQSLSVRFSRLQFTPDLMPSDVVGTTVFNPRETAFTFHPGPVFSNVVLVDEINRAPAKTQSALFEVMEEYQVTVDGTTYAMDDPFFVIATQNPIEQEGTYRLPEAQLDRFLFKIVVHYPSLAEEKAILRRFSRDFEGARTAVLAPVLSAERLREARRLVEQVGIREELLDYIAGVVHLTREHPDLFLGASPRASLAILKASKAMAAVRGRDFVTPDDIRQVAWPVLNHRILLTPERDMEGYEAKEVMEDILRRLEVPR